MRINIKPLSVNEAYNGKKVITAKYRAYKKLVAYSLKPIKMPEPPFKASYVFGFSNRSSDIDNPVKNLQDILQTYYGFNDRDIYDLHVVKKIVPKGEEYIEFKFEHIEI